MSPTDLPFDLFAMPFDKGRFVTCISKYFLIRSLPTRLERKLANCSSRSQFKITERRTKL